MKLRLIFLLLVLFVLQSIANDTFKSPLAETNVECDDDEMIITIKICKSRQCRRNKLRWYLPRTRGRTKKKRQHKLHMNDPHCVAAEFTRNRKFEILKFRTKFDECGTIEEFANNRLVYKQTIQTFKSKINSRIRPLKLEFQCDIRFSPATHLVPKYLKAIGAAQHQVFCGPNFMKLTLSPQMLPRYSPEEIHLRDPACKLTEERGSFVVITPYTGCGGEITYDAGKISMMNTLVSQLPKRIITRKQPVNVDFGCIYDKRTQKSAGGRVKPLREPYPDVNIRPKDSFDFDVGLVLLNKNMRQVNEYAAMKVGEMAHVRLYVDTKIVNLGLIPIAQSCFVTPSSNRSDEELDRFKHFLVNNKCIYDPTTKVETLKNGQLISFEVFAYTHDPTESLYIHCDAIMCDIDDEDCHSCPYLPQPRRGKRSIDTHTIINKLHYRLRMQFKVQF